LKNLNRYRHYQLRLDRRRLSLRYLRRHRRRQNMDYHTPLHLPPSILDQKYPNHPNQHHWYYQHRRQSRQKNP
jgi:hypothetical protein